MGFRGPTQEAVGRALSRSLRIVRTGVLRPHCGLRGNDPAYAKVDVGTLRPGRIQSSTQVGPAFQDGLSRRRARI
jgi:hypothetical protein